MREMREMREREREMRERERDSESVRVRVRGGDGGGDLKNQGLGFAPDRKKPCYRKSNSS